MTIRQEILQTCQAFLQQENKPKKNYRSFAGNVKKLSETPRLKELNLEELNICQEIQEFLKEWKENYTEHPKIYSQEKELGQLQERFSKWLESAQKKTKNTKLPKFNFSNHNSDWEDKLEKAEKGLEWLNWWKKHQMAIKFAATIISLLFVWLVIEKVKERFS